MRLVAKQQRPNLMKKLTVAEEQVLVRRAGAGDEQSLEALYRLHVARVYGLCLRLTGNTADADDATQDTFVLAWQRLEGFRGDSAFGTWLHRIAVNASLGRQRKQGREQQHLRSMEDEQCAGPRTQPGPDGRLEELEQAICRLPPGARHVFVLRAVYGYSHEEAGEMLDIAVGTSKAQLHRARKLLAAQLSAASTANQEDSGGSGIIQATTRHTNRRKNSEENGR